MATFLGVPVTANTGPFPGFGSFGQTPPDAGPPPQGTPPQGTPPADPAPTGAGSPFDNPATSNNPVGHGGDAVPFGTDPAGTDDGSTFDGSGDPLPGDTFDAPPPPNAPSAPASDIDLEDDTDDDGTPGAPTLTAGKLVVWTLAGLALLVFVARSGAKGKRKRTPARRRRK